ncbi:MAG: hypothetical protein K0S04_3007 [Herbinix sp.]|jgi:hypothetical protein|nr:hypothetical protein [Herbinix sp.]
MKKLLLMLLLSSTLLLTACGTNTTTSNESNGEAQKPTTAIEPSISGEESEASSSLDDIGDVEVDKGLFNVELTIPATYVEGQTQEDLNKTSEEKGYKSITLNDDGSATYVMTKQQHEDMMKEMTDSINSTLSELIGSDDYPNFTAIEANDNFTEFNITTTSTELDMGESFSVLMFYMYSGMFNIFNGTQVDNIAVTFINADTNEIISVSNSSDTNE